MLPFEIASSRDQVLLTFGYGNRKDHSQLLSHLKEYSVFAVIDVRRSPRAWTQSWHAKKIQTVCQDVGVQYLSEPALGNTSGTHEWTPPDEQAANQALQEVAALSEKGNVLLLCAELDPARCHRSAVALELQKQVELPIVHLS